MPWVTRWGKAYKTKTGYLRIFSKKEGNRGKYIHRVVAEEAWKEATGKELPEDKEIHHINWNKECFCRENLLILDRRLHNWHSMLNMVEIS